VELLELQGALPERYRVKRELGRGGMAIVYLAEDVPHGRDVAIKVLSPELGSSIDSERFKREIQIAARLSHPNILPAYDSGSANGLHYYVMPFIEGESLRARLDRESQLAIEDAIALTCEVADALSYAHSQGIVHRDVKPENVLIQSGHAVVADFGIARLLQDAGGEKLTATGISIGTAAYMSPEQFSGEKVDGRSDMYSLACMLYEMLVGQVPFTGPNAMAVMARHTMQPVPSIRLVRASVPESVEEVIMRALEKVPADRFATVNEFKDALLAGEDMEGFFQSTRSYATGHRSGNQPRRRRARRRRQMMTGAVVVAVLAVATVGARAVFAPRRTAFALASGETDLKRVGVLYFADNSPSGSLRFLADGLTESLIEQLDRVPTLDVVSRDGVRPFRGHPFAPDSVQRALHVGSIVRGEVKPSAKGAGVTVRLVDAADGVELARKSFDVDTANVLAAQKRLASEVAEFLRVAVGSEVKLKESRQAASNSQAWTLVQRAEQRRKEIDSLLAAGQPAAALVAAGVADAALARAASLDPEWVQPWVTRAALDAQRARAQRDHPPLATAAIDSGMAHVDRALAIEPRSADALELRGRLQFLRIERRLVPPGPKWNRLLEGAERDLRASVELNKEQAGAWATLSKLAYSRQSVPQALLAAQKAYEADAYLANAREILGRLFWASYDTENFPDAGRWCEEAHRRFPRDLPFVECRLWMLSSKGLKPDPDEAWRQVDTLKAITPPARWAYESRMGQLLVAGVLAKAGLPDSARRVLLRVRSTPDIDPDRELQGIEIVMRLFLKDYDEAMTLLEQYLTVHPDHRKGLATNSSPWWRDPAVQNDPRFKALIAGAR
jgi:TolB-like protein/predicted Ser/Thr protein kinase